MSKVPLDLLDPLDPLDLLDPMDLWDLLDPLDPMDLWDPLDPLDPLDLLDVWDPLDLLDVWDLLDLRAQELPLLLHRHARMFRLHAGRWGCLGLVEFASTRRQNAIHSVETL